MQKEEPNQYQCSKYLEGTKWINWKYLKEQTEYIQHQINKIRDWVENRQYRREWHTVNELRRMKSTAKARLKATRQEERIHLWKQHFGNLLGKLPKVTHEPITKIICHQLDIKLGQFMLGELDSLPRKIKNRKAVRLMKYPQKYRKIWNLSTYCSNTVRLYITKA